MVAYGGMHFSGRWSLTRGTVDPRISDPFGQDTEKQGSDEQKERISEGWVNSKYSTHTLLESLLSSVDNNVIRTLRLGTSPSSLSYCSSALESSQSYKSYPALGL